MVRILAFIRPHQLEEVKSAISALGIGGMNVTDAKGRGNSEERESRFLTEVDVLRMRARLEVVCADDLEPEVVAAIAAAAHTGQPGDGKIFVEPVEQAVRIRTEERGETAL